MTAATMTETILSMWLPLTVLLITGIVTIVLACWLAVWSEGHDEWLWDGNDE